jgi:hypothetical protein
MTHVRGRSAKTLPMFAYAPNCNLQHAACNRSGPKHGEIVGIELPWRALANQLREVLAPLWSGNTAARRWRATTSSCNSKNFFAGCKRET